MTAGSTALDYVLLCRESGPHVLVQCIAANIRFSPAKLKESAFLLLLLLLLLPPLPIIIIIIIIIIINEL